MNKPLLFIADFELDHNDLSMFDESHAAHMLKKMSVPGFLFGYRYLDQINPYRTVCLYGVESDHFLSSLFSKKISNRHPLLQELSQNDMIFDFINLKMGMYRLKSAFPTQSETWFGDFENLHLEYWDWNDPLNNETLGRQFDQLYLNEILSLPSQLRAYRFERVQHSVIDYMNSMPKNIAIVEAKSSVLASKEIYKLKQNKLPLLKSRALVDLQPYSKFWPVERSFAQQSQTLR